MQVLLYQRVRYFIDRRKWQMLVWPNCFRREEMKSGMDQTSGICRNVTEPGLLRPPTLMAPDRQPSQYNDSNSNAHFTHSRRFYSHPTKIAHSVSRSPVYSGHWWQFGVFSVPLSQDMAVFSNTGTCPMSVMATSLLVCCSHDVLLINKELFCFILRWGEAEEDWFISDGNSFEVLVL